MIDRATISRALDEDREFKRHWRRRVLTWHRDYPDASRNGGVFRNRIIETTCEAIECGETDYEVVVEKCCGSFVGTLIVGIAIRFLIELIVRRIFITQGLIMEDGKIRNA